MPDPSSIWYCPHCEKSYYTDQGGSRTLLGWTPIYKNGKLVNGDPNFTTWGRYCLQCEHTTTLRRRQDPPTFESYNVDLAEWVDENERLAKLTKHKEGALGGEQEPADVQEPT